MNINTQVQIPSDLHTYLAKGVASRKPSQKLGDLTLSKPPFGQHEYNEPNEFFVNRFIQPIVNFTKSPV